ncbi:2-amino-4-hydroxy-6-hydroxymethyldihydropteridine diphosphokinase [Pelagibacterium xiamenense]|uniref:2-amino-4-hydroxy-6- hydroxymethyldihydropteridine diphosphokinase n=1 Tax=Pelagibacterium xiamenense TaxID=2901140 RepID=UPI001E5EE1F4|nr:2-amino-4-hydroxy-6-hydroxymethyldihydropteridine diphosphokinase [Pelagibacterium xiamenense]MCD7061197.1 2-amino-4-hydroxy-6-hydroxymethyldihydropteridine diphosphokinase [Pelagibacterium xiamenense]
MATAILALGANIGDPAYQIEQAIAAIAANPAIKLVKASTVILTPPWGKTDQNDFHNAAIAIETSLSPEALLEVCLTIEESLGRIRVEKWGPRLIDIDLIAYNRLELETETLTIPHPHAHERGFVLDPVREIAPDVAQWLVERKR